MKTVGIIAEYNPFHFGHRYHIKQAKERTGAELAIIMMSGNYVQRGTPAYLDKYTRAGVALKNGADLVLELPLIYACSSAEIFATGAVSLLNKTGITDFLCFGTENADTGELYQAAVLLNEEPAEFKSLLKSELKSGLSFPAARMKALTLCCPGLKHTLSSPNNILGLEYLRAMLNTRSTMTPLAIKRIYAGYHDTAGDFPQYSASALRALDNVELLSSIDTLYTEQFHQTFPVYPKDFDLILGERLLSACHNNLLTEYADVNMDLANSIKNHMDEYQGFEEFIDILKKKHLTHTRISRSLLHIMLGLTQDSLKYALDTHAPQYVRVLGFTEKGRSLIGKFDPGMIPLVKTSDYKNQLKNPTDLMIFRQNLLADELYRMTAAYKYHSSIPTEFTYRIQPV